MKPKAEAKLKVDAAHPPFAVAFFFAVFFGALCLFAYVLWGFVTDLVLGFLIAGTARPLYLRALARVRGRAWLASGLVTTLVAVLVAIPAVYLITSLSQQAASAYTAIYDALGGESVQRTLAGEGWLGSRAERVFKAFGKEYSPETVRTAASTTAGTIAGFLSEQLNAVVSNVVSAVYHFAMMLVVVFYGLLDGPSFKRRIFDLSPLPDEEEELIVQKFKDVGSAILFGSGIASMLQGTLGGVALWVAGVPSPMFWGAIIAIFAFLPLIGTNMVVIPATIYLFVVERWAAGIGFFLFCNVQGLLIDNLLTPRLMGGRMQMHNLLIFFALVGGISTFGMAGLLYGPLLAALFLTLTDLYERVYRPRLSVR